MRSIACLLALSLTLGSVPAFGQSPDAYKTGVKLENAGDLVGALASFESIPEAKRDFNTRLHIAGVREKLGRYLEAEKDYEAIRTDPKADPATVDTAAAALQDLRARIPKLVVKVTAATTGVKVTLDGKEITHPATTAVNPGTHTVIAVRGTEQVFKREVTIAESTTLEVLVDAPAASSTVSASPPVSAAKPIDVAPSAPASSSQKTIGWITIGAGGAFAVLGIVSHLQANKAADDYSATCHDPLTPGYPNSCPDDGKSKVRTWESIRLASGIAAVVGIGVGVTLLLTAPKEGVAVKAQTGAVNGLLLEGHF
ncbi:MAG: hypothetical protein ACXVEE_11750 [Polyangiales bacterium]